jgi:prepilin-type N-terminal cleavage/methylation domain-containing protein
MAPTRTPHAGGTHRPRRRLSDHGFSIPELLAVLVVSALLAAVAIPAVLTFRNDQIVNSQKSDLQKVANDIDTILAGLRGAPSANITVTTAGSTYTITGPVSGNVADTGTLAAGHAITGTVWTDGSYCLTSTGIAAGGSATYIYRSDSRDAIAGTCPTSGFGSLTSTAAAAATSLPSALTIVATSPVAGTVRVTWATNALADSVAILVDGKQTATFPADDLTATISGVEVGTRVITAYPVNTNGYGPKTTASVTVRSIADEIGSTVTPTISWNALPLNSNTTTGWSNFNAQINSGTATWNVASYAKSGGIVDVRGRIRPASASSLANGTVVGTLPAGYRPDTDLIFPVVSPLATPTTRTVLVDAETGNISLLGSFTSVTSISLDGIVFPAAGTLTWTNLTLQSGYAAYSTTNYGNPRYAIDADGNAWFAGVVATPATITVPVTVTTIPAAGAPANLQYHAVGTSQTVSHGIVSISSAGALQFRAPATLAGAGPWFSLAGIVTFTTAGNTAITWTSPPTPTGYTQVQGPTTYAPGYGQSPTTGLVYLRGLISQPTTISTTTPMFFLPLDQRPTLAGQYVTPNSDNSCSSPTPSSYQGVVDLSNLGVFLTYSEAQAAASTCTRWMSLHGVAAFPDNADDRY